MNSWNDPRAGEVNRLQLAPTLFALQLDAFELQTSEVLRAIGRSKNNECAREFDEGGKIACQ